MARTSSRLSARASRTGTTLQPARAVGLPVGFQVPPLPQATVPARPTGTPATRPVLVPPLVFSLTPAKATRGILDYTSRAGERLYEAAIKELDSKKYDGEPDGLLSFLELLEERAHKNGWNTSILMIPSVTGTTSNNLIQDYGTITLERIKDHEETYIDTPSRDAQDTNLLYECIMNSVSREGKSKITMWKKDYWLNGYSSGNLLLKVLIRECHMDTNATIGSIRQKLSNLDTYLPTVGYNISKFNMYVSSQVEQLRARGQYSNDLLMNLFKGYMAASDKAFVSYIDKKLETYEEGTNIKSDQLMLWARQKYDLLMEKGLWNAPTEDEEKILALTAQVKQMEKRFSSKGKAKGNQQPIQKRERTPKKEKPTWFAVQPADTKKKVKWNKKEWNWCGKATGGKCEAFTIHYPSACKGLTPNAKSQKKTKYKNVQIKAEEGIIEEPTDRNGNDDGFESDH